MKYGSSENNNYKIAIKLYKKKDPAEDGSPQKDREINLIEEFSDIASSYMSSSPDHHYGLKKSGIQAASWTHESIEAVIFVFRMFTTGIKAGTYLGTVFGVTSEHE